MLCPFSGPGGRTTLSTQTIKKEAVGDIYIAYGLCASLARQRNREASVPTACPRFLSFSGKGLARSLTCIVKGTKAWNKQKSIRHLSRSTPLSTLSEKK